MRANPLANNEVAVGFPRTLGHVSPQSMLAIEPRMIIILEDVVQSPLNTRLFSFVLGATPYLKYRFPFKTSNRTRHLSTPLGEFYFCVITQQGKHALCGPISMDPHLVQDD